ncbi:MAG: winged helix-turn-helix domain-containing protein [Actinomycetota bacterium]
MRYRFGSHVVDDERLELLDGDEVIAIEPQAFAVLGHLLRERHRVVPKHELLDEVWGDQFVSESALTTRIKQIRRAVGDSGSAQAVIRTSHGTGYRFVAEVDELTDGDPTRRSGVDEPTTVNRPRPRSVPGRSTEIDRIVGRAGAGRVVTLVGVGGIGKSRLLHHVGARLGHDHDDGAVLVELASVRSDDDVAPAVLDALGGGGAEGRAAGEEVLVRLRSADVVLLLDNAEHVLATVAALCDEIVRSCPGVVPVATSRARLGIGDETVVPIGPLDPDAAVDVFVARAGDAGVDLDPTDPRLRELCGRVDGIPLALELLAARTRLLSLDDLLSDLQRHLDRARPHGQGRHRSVEAALRWSLDGVTEVERQLLEALTVFAGSFDLRAVEAVAGFADPTDSLLELCERSLVVAMPVGRESRFRLLEPVRLFAADTSAALDDARRRHADHYLDVLADASELLDRRDLDAGLDRMALEWANVRVAVATMLHERDLEGLSEAVGHTANYAEARLAAEVHEWADHALVLAAELGVEPRTDLRVHAARFRSHHGDMAAVDELLDGIDPAEGLRSSVIGSGLLVRDWYAGRADVALATIDAALEREAGTGAYWELSYGLLRLAGAGAIGERPVGILDRLASLGHLPSGSSSVAAAAAEATRRWWEDDVAGAVATFDTALAAADRIGCAGFRQLLSTMRSRVVSELDDREVAAATIADSLVRGADSGAWSIVAGDLGMAARVLIELGDAATAARLEAARLEAGYRASPASATGSVSGRLEAALGDELDRHHDQGRLLTIEQAATQAIGALRARGRPEAS